MKTRWMSIAAGLGAVLALAVCTGSNGPGSGGGGAGGSTGGAGGANCTCACTTRTSANGCSDLCNDMVNGQTGTPNFCDGAAALTQCAACLQKACGFSASEVTNGTLCM
jgi:hypothetical protein